MQPTRLLRVQDVAEKIGIGKSTVWRWVKNGRFPKPIKLSSRVTVWKELEIDKWIEEHCSTSGQ